jgi:hypothetical protein
MAGKLKKFFLFAGAVTAAGYLAANAKKIKQSVSNALKKRKETLKTEDDKMSVDIAAVVEKPSGAPEETARKTVPKHKKAAKKKKK